MSDLDHPPAAPAADPPPVLRVRDLRRWFGPVRAVDGVSFDVHRGQVVGFIGANGAGKTTTLRVIATLDVPDSGTVAVAGHDAVEEPAAVRRLLGWMPDHIGVYDQMTVLDYLDFFARAHGLRGAARRSRLDEVADFTELRPLLERPMGALSKGQGQRLSLARTLLHDPALLLLDEPAAGLDPKARIEFKNLVRLLQSQGRTLIISSHILSELAEMCDTMLFIDAGRIVRHGGAETLTRQADDRALVAIDAATTAAAEALRQWLALRAGWSEVTATAQGVRAAFVRADPDSLAAELRRMVVDGIEVCRFAAERRRLEDVFVEVLEQESAARRAAPPAPGP